MSTLPNHLVGFTESNFTHTGCEWKGNVKRGGLTSTGEPRCRKPAHMVRPIRYWQNAKVGVSGGKLLNSFGAEIGHIQKSRPYS